MINKIIKKNVFNLSIPVVAEMIIYTLMSIFDLIMIGNYGGNTCVSAVGISNGILNTCSSIFISSGICISITSLISRSVGGRKFKTASEFAYMGTVVGLFISLAISSFIFFFNRNILYYAGARGDVLALSSSYTKILSIALFFNMTTSLLNSILRSYGNTYTPFLISFIICLLKIILDYFMIFGIFVTNMGIDGAAFASLVSQFVGFLCILTYIIFKVDLKKSFINILKLNKHRLQQIIFLAIPSSLEEAAYSISRLLGTFIIMGAGTKAFASNEIANTVESISVTVGIGFGLATSTLVGFKIGEKEFKKAKEYAYNCVFLSTSVMLVFSAIFIFFPKTLTGLFVNKAETEVLYYASLCLIIGAAEQPFIAISLVLSGALKGLGDTKSPFYISLISSWCIRLPLIFYFIYLHHYPVTSVWWITTIQWGFDAFFMYLSFKYKIYKYSSKPTIGL